MFILYNNTGIHSGRALRKMLGELHSGEVQGGYPKRFSRTVNSGEKPDVIVNLGVTEDIPYDGKILNTQDMVRAASNKRKARQIFVECKVPTPELYLKPGAVSKEDLPVIGRTSYHRKGEGFWFCKTLAAVRKDADEGATHFLEFIPNTREYRVHTFIKRRYWDSKERKPANYVSIKISEKVWQGKRTPSQNKPQKNHAFGWTFLGPQGRREEELDVVRHAAKQAIAALGMDFGAVDVMYRVRAKQPYVLEVNSTPSLSDENATTCEVYANRIMKTLRKAKEE